MPTFSPSPDVSLAYDCVGDGPGLLCLNGLGAGHASFAQVEAACKDRRTVVRFDWRGTFDSTATGASATDFSWQDCATDALALMDHLGIATFDVAGMSFGGVVAQLIGYLRPDAINHCFLISTSHVKTAYGIRINRMIQTLINRVPPEEFGELMSTFAFSQDFHDAHPTLRSLRQEGISQEPPSPLKGEEIGVGFEGRYRAAFKRMAELGATVPEEFTAPFPIPPARVTAIVGSHDLMVSASARASILALSASPVVLQGAGHVIAEVAGIVGERIGIG